MSEFLFATFDGGGNVPAVLAVVGELVERGHHVSVFSNERQRAEVVAVGATFRGYERARPWDARAARGTVDGVRDLVRVQTDPGMGADIAAAVATLRPDAVVVDCMLLGVSARLVRDGVEHATLFHTLYRYWAGSFRWGPVGLGSRLVRCGDPLRLWRRSALQLVCTDPELDAVARRRHPEATWVGAVHDAAAPAVPPARSAEPTVLVSLSTVGYPGLARTLGRVIDAAARVPARFVVTTGPAVDPAALPTAANVEIRSWAPHDELMPTCSALIGHGGHSTTMRALAHDLPVLTLPMHPLIDQPFVGRAVARAGAGLVVSRNAPAAALRRSMGRLLAEQRYRDGAARVGRRLRATDAAGAAADHLEALAGRPVRPVRRAGREPA